MTKNPSRKLPEVFVLIIPKVIRIHWHLSEWGVVALTVCRPRRIFVLIIVIPQVIRMHFGDSEWEVVVVRRLRRGVKLLKDIDILANYGIT